jgi:hypothetical protein
MILFARLQVCASRPTKCREECSIFSAHNPSQVSAFYDEQSLDCMPGGGDNWTPECVIDAAIACM